METVKEFIEKHIKTNGKYDIIDESTSVYYNEPKYYNDMKVVNFELYLDRLRIYVKPF